MNHVIRIFLSPTPLHSYTHRLIIPYSPYTISAVASPMTSPAFIFDFDSTLVSVESLDELLAESVKRKEKGSKAEKIMAEIHAITDAGMEGEIDLRTSLTRRLAIARPSRKDIVALQKSISKTMTKGLPEIMRMIHAAGASAFIVSGAIRDLIEPVAQALGIPDDHFFGNTPFFDQHDFLTDIADGPLVTSQGKAEIILQLVATGAIDGPVIMIGDGASDLHPFLTGVADHFIGVGIHTVRTSVEAGAPVFVRTSRDLDLAIRSSLSL